MNNKENIILRYKFIHEINKEQFIELYNIVSNDDIMKWIGNGKIWTKEKLMELIKYSKEDYYDNFKSSKYLYNIVLHKNKVIGLIGLHPYKINNNSLQITILISKEYQGKGLSKKIIKKIISLKKKYFNKYDLYYIYKKTNIKSGNVILNNKNIKINKCNDTKFNNEDYYVYKILN